MGIFRRAHASAACNCEVRYNDRVVLGGLREHHLLAALGLLARAIHLARLFVGYASLELVVCLPLVFVGTPTSAGASITTTTSSTAKSRLAPEERASFVLLAATLVTAAALVTAVSVYLVSILRARGSTLEHAVAVAALIGPAQVGMRVVDAFAGRHLHPIWTLACAITLLALGLGMIAINAPFLAVAVTLYGAGSGVFWVARGTVPLALFGSERYSSLSGLLARPTAFAQALMPPAIALGVERLSLNAMAGVLALLAVCNVGLVAALTLVSRCARRRSVPRNGRIGPGSPG